MKDIYDVVVIGSGFGGAINACRLAQAGRSVCILERGKRWGKKDFPRTTGQVAHSFWNYKDLGLLDYWRRSGHWPDFCETEPGSVCAAMKRPIGPSRA